MKDKLIKALSAPGKRMADKLTAILDLHLTPTQLREIADDLEREGRGYCRTVETADGTLIDILLPWEEEK